jgi:hypothetical protein
VQRGMAVEAATMCCLITDSGAAPCFVRWLIGGGWVLSVGYKANNAFKATNQSKVKHLDAVEEPLLEGARVEHRLRRGERLGHHHHLGKGWLIDWFGGFVGSGVGWLVDWFGAWRVGWLVGGGGWLVESCERVKVNVLDTTTTTTWNWLVGWLVGWLGGWLFWG